MDAFIALGGNADRTGEISTEKLRAIIKDFGLPIDIDVCRVHAQLAPRAPPPPPRPPARPRPGAAHRVPAAHLLLDAGARVGARSASFARRTRTTRA